MPDTFFSYLTPFFLVICTLPALLTSLLIVCTRDCTPSCETCPRYFSCFRFKVYFQYLHTLPRDPWIPPPRYVSFKRSPLFYILIAIFLSSRWRSEVGYRVIYSLHCLSAMFYHHQMPGVHSTPMNQSRKTHYNIRTSKISSSLEMFS